MEEPHCRVERRGAGNLAYVSSYVLLLPIREATFIAMMGNVPETLFILFRLKKKKKSILSTI